ncbi:MAG: ferredoxin [Candidatus Nealsonbacteria bacterium]|jgi:ferredoxin|nr:ferredoxin [Candidatus Nealsonbacteria bacterium]
MENYSVNKDKCLGCGVCTVNCPGGMELEADGKAKVIDADKVAGCGGTDVCPQGAIEKKEEGAAS